MRYVLPGSYPYAVAPSPILIRLWVALYFIGRMCYNWHMADSRCLRIVNLQRVSHVDHATCYLKQQALRNPDQ